MAHLKTGTTIGAEEIANINLDGVSKASFSATHLSSITGVTGGSGTAATAGKSGNSLTSTGNSSINMSSVQNLRFNGSNKGYSKVYLNGTRIWEKYQTNDPYQVWVSSGYNASVQVDYVGTPQSGGNYGGYSYYYHLGFGQMYTWGGAHTTGIIQYGPNFGTFVHLGVTFTYMPDSWAWSENFAQGRTYFNMSVPGTAWVDTSSYQTQYQMVDHFYY